MEDNQPETIPEFKPSPFGTSGGTLGAVEESELPVTANPPDGDNSSSDDATDEDTED